MNARPKWSNASAGEREDLPDDRADEDDDTRARHQRQAMERKIAEPAAKPGRRACKGLDVGTALTARERTEVCGYLARHGVHQVVTSSPPPFFPCEEGARARSSGREPKTRGEILTRRTLAVLAHSVRRFVLTAGAGARSSAGSLDRRRKLVRRAARVGVDSEGRRGVRRQGDIRADRIGRWHQADHEPHGRLRRQRRAAHARPVRGVQGLRPDSVGAVCDVTRLPGRRPAEPLHLDGAAVREHLPRAGSRSGTTRRSRS